MVQVFISYSRKDLPFVEHLAKDLQGTGLEAWAAVIPEEAGQVAAQPSAWKILSAV